MEVREYQEEDYEATKNVVKTTLDNMYPEGPEGEDTWESLGKYKFTGYEKVYVAVDDSEKVVGCVMIKGVDDWSKIKTMYVLPGLQRSGVGEMLLQKAINYSKEKEYTRIVLSTYAEMIGAMKFYEKHGFKKVEAPGDRYFTDPTKKEYNAKQIVYEMMI